MCNLTDKGNSMMKLFDLFSKQKHVIYFGVCNKRTVSNKHKEQATFSKIK